jgi:hypothetical protein
MVFDDPPAPAARDELGLETCDVAARRLPKKEVSEMLETIDLRGDTRTGFAHQAVWRLQLLRSATRRSGRVRQSQTRWEK